MSRNHGEGDSLERRLNALADSDWYPFHMPGHKRNPEFAREYTPVYRMDITEIAGFDNLHSPSGILRDAMENAAQWVGADRTWFLVNGSTCGIQAALGAVAKPGEKVLLARNFHRSAGQMLALRDFRPVFVLPEEAEPLADGDPRPDQTVELFTEYRQVLLRHTRLLQCLFPRINRDTLRCNDCRCQCTP